ncbi:phosphoserine phosphatase SerB [Rodentibacter caecimuris]|uniref:Phosphoserine phosphatase n=1 Tax=Rodentibacter caecimuris TaxID=1796644 RepID=A0AAJ3K5C4_9PAST|nr:phosphoserine phosphatase [Rodentibacter heylii]AOF53807.1 Phosphoserine phosphatase [Pasteurellaceae bacterium NI1060]MCQ9124442.1 phosphoserine phosphatase [Rodentibacter heylii]OOF72993.1 phosphoserine phosphatase SerB [Rodentibacter heylii]OOF74340.1 phosphoserine phosphatase SerB [Rodentibacter heylii]OOF74440.1 phosphoserine phosphatase SerB [Rodentibacter heylii]
MQIQNLASITQKYPILPTALWPESPLALLTDNFILYSTQLNLSALTLFQQKCGQNFQCFDAWNVAKNTVVLLQGEWQDAFLSIAHELGLDIARLNFETKLSEPGLLVMDMDSTAIQIECIDEIAKLAGTGELVSAITESAMRGELDFEQSLRRRVSTLKDAPESILQEVRANLPLMPGLQETLKILQKHGWKTAIASGGFTYFADYLKDLLKLDYAVSNQFDIVDGKLTGLVKGDVVDAQHKAYTLQRLRDEYSISAENTLAIGDGANDLAMMKVAGLGVAFHAKPKVQQQAQIVVNFADLTALLCLLSAKDRI